MKLPLSKILVLEDDLETHLILFRKLKHRDWNLFFALSNTAARAVLEHEQDIDLIVSDFQLRSETTAAFFRFLNRENCEIPCVFYSSSPIEDIIVNIDYPYLLRIIPKPNLELLVHALESILDF